jgi:hypothetical protein
MTGPAEINKRTGVPSRGAEAIGRGSESIIGARRPRELPRWGVLRRTLRRLRGQRLSESLADSLERSGAEIKLVYSLFVRWMTLHQFRRREFIARLCGAARKGLRVLTRHGERCRKSDADHSVTSPPLRGPYDRRSDCRPRFRRLGLDQNRRSHDALVD